MRYRRLSLTLAIRPYPCSLAINAGTPDGAPAIDRDGRARDALPDIGAFEFGSP
ncbi:MAG: choice-of-anchor Q domain-containing protein [Chloroflexota bacterium]